MAQKPATGPKKKKKELPPGAAAHMSIVALGAIPRRRYKMPDRKDLDEIEGSTDERETPKPGGDQGKRKRSRKSRKKTPADSGASDIPILLPPKPGAVPPSALYYRLVKPNNGNPWGRMRVGFNNATSITQIQAGVPLEMHSMDREHRSTYKKYITIPPLKPWSQILVFLTPGRKGKTPWKHEPSVSILNLRSKALKHKNLFVKNFSNQTIHFIVGNHQPETLPPGKSRSFALKKSTGYHRIAAMNGKKRTLIINTSVRVPQNTLTVFAFHNADPQTNGGKNIGVFRTTISKLPPSVLKKKLPTPTHNGGDQ